MPDGTTIGDMLQDSRFIRDENAPEVDLEARERDAMAELFAEWAEDFASKLPLRFRDCTLESYVPDSPDRAEARLWCDGYLKCFDRSRPGVFITGPVGCGKTHLAVGVARELAKKGLRARFLNTQAYLEKLRTSYGGNVSCPDPRRISETCDVLVLDDIGVEKPSEWVREQLFSLIDGAYGNRLVVLATSNHDYAELGKPDVLGERTVSRLVELTDKLVIKASDWRKEQHKGRRS